MGESEQAIAERAKRIRKHVITMIANAGSGHPASSLGLAEIFASLYFSVLSHNPKKPWWPKRDRLILSGGHSCPAWYATLAEAGYFPASELSTLRKLNSRLQGHPVYRSAPGVENSAGSLSQGLSVACGIALSIKLRKESQHVYCLMGDGEQQEGQVWESYWFAGVHRLQNLTVIIDRNTIQSEGYTEDILSLEPFKQKLEAFGMHVLEIDGHNIEAIIDACNAAKSIREKPVAIIAHTIPGKGVDYMEGDYSWHAKAPNPQQAKEALRELKTIRGSVENT